MPWALVGCNLSQRAVCGNYLLHGSAVGNRDDRISAPDAL